MWNLWLQEKAHFNSWCLAMPTSADPRQLYTASPITGPHVNPIRRDYCVMLEEGEALRSNDSPKILQPESGGGGLTPEQVILTIVLTNMVQRIHPHIVWKLVFEGHCFPRPCGLFICPKFKENTLHFSICHEDRQRTHTARGSQNTAAGQGGLADVSRTQGKLASTCVPASPRSRDPLPAASTLTGKQTYKILKLLFLNSLNAQPIFPDTSMQSQVFSLHSPLSVICE